MNNNEPEEDCNLENDEESKQWYLENEYEKTGTVTRR